MAVADRRQRRSGRLLLLALALTVIVVVGNVVASRSDGGPDQSRTFLDRARPLAMESARHGGDLADLRERGPELGRDGLRSRLERLAAETRRVADTITAIEPPAADRRAHGLLLTALVTRADAVASLDSILRRALDGGEVDAAQALSTVGAELVVADQAHALFVRGLPADVSPPMPAARWIDDPARWEPAPLAAFVDALRAQAVLAPVHDVRLLTVSTQPAPVAREGDQDVLPITRSLRLDVVVANVGNEPERRVPVEAIVTSPTGAVDSTRQFVDLAPGQSVAVTLAGLQTTPGGTSILLVRVGPVAGEATPADNEQARPFLAR